MRGLFIAVLLGSQTVGCASMSDVVAERRAGGGTSRLYPVAPHIAYAESREALRAEDVNEIKEYPSYLVADTGMTAFSWGAYFGVFIEPLSAWQTRVVVVAKRKLATNIFVPFTEEQFLDRLGRRLAPFAPTPIPIPPPPVPMPAPSSNPLPPPDATALPPGTI